MKKSPASWMPFQARRLDHHVPVLYQGLTKAQRFALRKAKAALHLYPGGESQFADIKSPTMKVLIARGYFVPSEQNARFRYKIITPAGIQMAEYAVAMAKRDRSANPYQVTPHANYRKDISSAGREVLIDALGNQPQPLGANARTGRMLARMGLVEVVSEPSRFGRMMVQLTGSGHEAAEIIATNRYYGHEEGELSVTVRVKMGFAQEKNPRQRVAGGRLGPADARKGIMSQGMSAGIPISFFDPVQLQRGTQVEMREHGGDPLTAQKIAMDHLVEHRDYYVALAKMERELESNPRKKKKPSVKKKVKKVARKADKEVREVAQTKSGRTTLGAGAGALVFGVPGLIVGGVLGRRSKAPRKRNPYDVTGDGRPDWAPPPFWDEGIRLPGSTKGLLRIYSGIVPHPNRTLVLCENKGDNLIKVQGPEILFPRSKKVAREVAQGITVDIKAWGVSRFGSRGAPHIKADVTSGRFWDSIPDDFFDRVYLPFCVRSAIIPTAPGYPGTRKEHVKYDAARRAHAEPWGESRLYERIARALRPGGKLIQLGAGASAWGHAFPFGAESPINRDLPPEKREAVSKYLREYMEGLGYSNVKFPNRHPRGITATRLGGRRTPTRSKKAPKVTKAPRKKNPYRGGDVEDLRTRHWEKSGVAGRVRRAIKHSAAVTIQRSSGELQQGIVTHLRDAQPGLVVTVRLSADGLHGRVLEKHVQLRYFIDLNPWLFDGIDDPNPSEGTLRALVGNPKPSKKNPRKTLYIYPNKSAIKAAERGLKTRDKAPKSKKGGLDAMQAAEQGIGSGVLRARDIVAGKRVNAYQVKAFFDRHRGNYVKAKADGLRAEESKAIQAWLIWGGDALYRQAKRAVESDRAGRKVPYQDKSSAKKAPKSARALIARSRRLWEAYTRKATRANLMRFRDHLEEMKGSSAKTVQQERRRALRAFNAEMKSS